MSHPAAQHNCSVFDFLLNQMEPKGFRTFSLTGGGYSGMQFSWRTRSRICIGVARGLAFLHEEVRPYIVHRDIKASNILLDGNLNPKIADFGLAKLIPSNMTHVSTRVAGTMWVPEFLFLLVKSCFHFQFIVFSEIRTAWKPSPSEIRY